MGKGWVKLHRALLKKPIWLESSVEHKTILITLLLSANYDKNEWVWNGRKYMCEGGQFITSLNSILENSGKGITIQNVRSALTRFEKLGFLKNESIVNGRLITILNWEEYQQEGDPEDCEILKNDAEKKPNKEPKPKPKKATKEDKEYLLNKSTEAFKTEVMGYLDRPEYADRYDMLYSFFKYWSEPNRSRTKIKRDQERTWDTSRRIAFWARRDKQFNKNKRSNEANRTDILQTKKERTINRIKQRTGEGKSLEETRKLRF